MHEKALIKILTMISQKLAQTLRPPHTTLIPPHPRRMSKLQTLNDICKVRAQSLLLNLLDGIQVCSEKEEDGFGLQ
jgi:hypothetical protein